ncbi:MAG: hypothetical protein C0500_06520 [Sphingobium sp.]|nr:hypothetical protein [Sphingobium sp.]
MSDILYQQMAAPAAFVRDQLAAGTGATAAAEAAPQLGDEERALIAELNQAVKAWRATPEAQAFIASLPQRNVEEVREYLHNVVRGPHFARTIELSASHSLSSLIPQSISIGLAGQIELLVGIYGSIGYIDDLTLDGGNSAIYLLGALAEGLDATIDVSAQAGLWTDAVDDASGSYVGGELEVDEGVGLSGFVLLKKEVVKAAMVDADGGIGDGASALEFYMLTHETSHGPVAQSPASHMLILSNLLCRDASESGHDEVYLKFSIDGSDTVYRYPTWDYYSMNPDDSDKNWALGRSIWLNSKVEVSIWDSDDGNDDELHSFKINVSDFSGTGSSHAKTYQSEGKHEDYHLTAYLMDLNA